MNCLCIEKFGEYVPPAGGVNIIAEKLESCVLDASNPNITTAEDKVMSKKEKAQRKKVECIVLLLKWLRSISC